MDLKVGDKVYLKSPYTKGGVYPDYYIIKSIHGYFYELESKPSLGRKYMFHVTEKSIIPVETAHTKVGRLIYDQTEEA